MLCGRCSPQYHKSVGQAQMSTSSGSETKSAILSLNVTAAAAPHLHDWDNCFLYCHHLLAFAARTFQYLSIVRS